MRYSRNCQSYAARRRVKTARRHWYVFLVQHDTFRMPVDRVRWKAAYFTRFSARQHGFSYDRADIVHFYKEYLHLMARWRSILSADRFIEVDYEHLIADQESVNRRIIEFCGLEWSDSCLDFHETNRPILTASAWQARQPIYKTSMKRWRRYEPWLGEFRELLSLDKSSVVAPERPDTVTSFRE